MDKVQADLLFNDYRIKKISFELNPNPSPDLMEFDMQVGAGVDIDPEQGKATVHLELEVCPDFLTSGFPFNLQIEMEGNFGFHTNVELSKITPLLRQNSLAILYPYVRAAVSSITSAANVVPPLVLPPVNILKLLEQQSANEG